MTREEVENCIVNTLFECTHSGEDDTISDKEFAAVLADKFIDHESDLLKKFVELIEDRLTIWIKDENYQANIAEAENDHLRKNTSLLIAETIEAIKNFMKPALEKFLEETKQDDK